MSSKIKIMILDDDEGIIEMLKSYLSSYDVKGVTQSKSGIESLKKEKYDLLILDYYVDDLNGKEIIEKVRKFDNNLYILLLTGFAEDVPGLKSLEELDIQDYVEKNSVDESILRIKSAIKSVELNSRNNDGYQGFPSQLKNLRKIYNVNQEDLARYLELSRTNIANYERGFNLPSIDILIKMADYFGVTIDYLLCHTVGLPKLLKK